MIALIALIVATLGLFSERKEIDPPFFWDSSNLFRRISADTFCSLVDARYPNFKKLIVVDCRTAREYNGGHIKGAIRRHPFEYRATSVYDEIYDPETLIIFHCEFSALRAPESIKKFTSAHRAAGRDPATLHAFILDGGYSQFWPAHPEYCDGRYVPENPKETPL
jgi:M-phase inducer tyrosine phosphatase